MNALVATKAAITLGWLLATAAYVGSGVAAAAAAAPAAPPAASAAGAHPKIGKTDCTECHGDLTSKPHVHPAAMDCTGCHAYTETPQAAEGQMKLVAEGNALCYTCHADMQDAFKQKKFAHSPAQEDCTSCHDPHSSANEKMLKDKTNDLCLTCHADMKEQLDSAKYVHQAIKEHGCTTCHNPHTADVAPMLRQEPEKLCLSCHAWESKPDPANTTSKRILATPEGKGHPYVGHPYEGIPDPSGKGGTVSCLGCHDPHMGSTPQRFKAGKADGDFCTRCH